MPLDTWNSFEGTEHQSFWDTYSRGRPQLPDSTWNRIFDYHRQYGNAVFEHVNDLGSGPGIFAPVLAQHFEHVTLTDPAEKNIEAAKSVLGRSDAHSKYDFKIGRAEDQQSEQVYDMVFMGNSLHWIDPKVSLPNIAASLRPGGTFAAYLLCSPDFIRPRAFQAWTDWVHAGFKALAAKAPSSMLGFNAVAAETGYDCIGFDPARWRDVQRVHLNAHRPHGLGTCEEIISLYRGPLSSVTAYENIVNAEDRGWFTKTDLAGVRDFMATIPLAQTDEVNKQFWDVIEEEYTERPVEILFRVDMVLATKR